MNALLQTVRCCGVAGPIAVRIALCLVFACAARVAFAQPGGSERPRPSFLDTANLDSCEYFRLGCSYLHAIDPSDERHRTVMLRLDSLLVAACSGRRGMPAAKVVDLARHLLSVDSLSGAALCDELRASAPVAGGPSCDCSGDRGRAIAATAMDALECSDEMTDITLVLLRGRKGSVQMELLLTAMTRGSGSQAMARVVRMINGPALDSVLAACGLRREAFIERTFRINEDLVDGPYGYAMSGRQFDYRVTRGRWRAVIEALSAHRNE